MFSKVFLLDLLERSVATFVQAFAASLIVTGLDDYKSALAIGGGAGILAVAKSLGARNLGDPDSASVLQPEEEIEDVPLPPLPEDEFAGGPEGPGRP